MRRALFLLVLAVAGIACDALHPLSEADFQMSPALASTYLRYHVSSPRGEWSREFAVSRSDFAELRETSGRPYALGLKDALAWLRVGARAPVEIDGALAADERREAAWIGMRFGEGGHAGHLELEQCHGGTCTLVYTPRDGHALWVDVDRKTRRPSSFEWIAQDHAVESCEDVEWSDTDGAPAIASATCSAIVDKVGRETTRWTLEERRAEAVPPEWAQIRPEDVIPLRPARDVVEVAVADPSQRIYVPVEAGGSQPLRLVLDTGSPITVLTRRVVDELGVVPSPEPPVHVHPPWLPEDTYDPEIVDRLVIAGIELHGVPVLVPRNDSPFAGEEAGLLGMDLMSRYVVDVDGPASMLRIWPRQAFVASVFSGVAFTDLPYWGASHGMVVVGGAVDELGPMPVLVDTGAPLNVVVGGPAMHSRHPRQRGEEMRLSEDDSYDYTSEVEGFHFGPFGLPRMPAMGHDRRPDLPFLDSGGALGGLGVLRHFRIAVDSRRGVVHVAPGPSYVVLTRLGFEIDDRNGAPTITRIVYGEHDWNKPLRVGDVVRAVDGRKVRSRTEALARIAGAKRQVRVTVERHGNVVSKTLAM
jgi:hypothetical protein